MPDPQILQLCRQSAGRASPNEDPATLLQQLSVDITTTELRQRGFAESSKLKQLRQALQAPPGDRRRELWKQSRKLLRHCGNKTP